MSMVLYLVLWVLVAALVAVALALILPLRIECRGSLGAGPGLSVALRPFAPLGPRIALTGRKGRDAPARPRKKATRHGGGAPAHMVRPVLGFLSEIWAHLRVHRCALDLRFGCGDPAETGQVFGMAAPLIYGRPPSPNVDIRVEPVFDRSQLSGRADLDLSLIPVSLVPALARLGWALARARR